MGSPRPWLIPDARYIALAVLAVIALAVAGVLSAVSPDDDARPAGAGRVSETSSPVPLAAPAPERSPGVEVTEAPVRRSALLVVGGVSLNAAESEVRSVLRDDGFVVDVVEDSAVRADDADGNDVILISKTVESVAVDGTFKTTDVGVVFWEDNAQAVETGGEEGSVGTGTPMLATIGLVNPSSTAWHAAGTDVYVNPAAPDVLRGGLTGPVRFYASRREMTFAPRENGATTLPASATWVAEYAEAGDGRYVYYVIDENAGLADGTDRHGRRAYFGLYDASFPDLTADGLRLFRAAVAWAAAP